MITYVLGTLLFLAGVVVGVTATIVVAYCGVDETNVYDATDLSEWEEEH